MPKSTEVSKDLPYLGLMSLKVESGRSSPRQLTKASKGVMPCDYPCSRDWLPISPNTRHQITVW